MERRKKLGLVLGPVLFLAAYLSPVLEGSPRAHRLLAVFLLIVVWWVTECLPIPVTALTIPIFLTVFGITSAREALGPFSNPIILLFLGSFILARAMCVHGIDRRLALSILSLRAIGAHPVRILFALGLTSLVLSMWISNTATTAMMYPIALGILDSFRNGDGEAVGRFPTVLLLTLAYGASIGGIGTPIGSPPNLIAIGMLERLAGIRIDFFQWMVIGFLVLIPTFIILFLFMRGPAARQKAPERLDLEDLRRGGAGGRLQRGQVNVLIAFSITVILWVLPGAVSLLAGREAPVYVWLHTHIPESIAAMIGACLLFLLPVDLQRGRFTLTMKDALRVDWGTLLLFGGGLSLGFQMFDTGLADVIGRAFISLGGDAAAPAVITLLAVALSVFLTELTSNTASANMIIPIIIAIAGASGINPLPPVLGSAIGCSFAFMLPVATPPNAIIYGSGKIPLSGMMRHGFRMNLAGIVIIWLMVTLAAPLAGMM